MASNFAAPDDSTVGLVRQQTPMSVCHLLAPTSNSLKLWDPILAFGFLQNFDSTRYAILSDWISKKCHGFLFLFFLIMFIILLLPPTSTYSWSSISWGSTSKRRINYPLFDCGVTQKCSPQKKTPTHDWLPQKNSWQGKQAVHWTEKNAARCLLCNFFNFCSEALILYYNCLHNFFF